MGNKKYPVPWPKIFLKINAFFSSEPLRYLTYLKYGWA